MQRSAISPIVCSNSSEQFKNRNEASPPLTKYWLRITHFLLNSSKGTSPGKNQLLSFVGILDLRDQLKKSMSEHIDDKIKEFEYRLKKFQEKYQSYAQENENSKSNDESSRKINAILFEKAIIDENDLVEIKRLVDWTERQLHWDGVSWMDYKIHVKAYLNFKGFKIELQGI
jgi:hypothetical protein